MAWSNFLKSFLQFHAADLLKSLAALRLVLDMPPGMRARGRTSSCPIFSIPNFPEIPVAKNPGF